MENIVKKYCPERKSTKIRMIEPEVEEENLRLQEILRKSISEFRKKNEHEITSFRRDDFNRMAENQILLKEINSLRAMVRQKPQNVPSQIKELPGIATEGEDTGNVEVVAVKKAHFANLPLARSSAPLPSIGNTARALQS